MLVFLVVSASGNGVWVSDPDLPVRLRLDLAYDGSFFHGWARQPGLRTVQGTVEAALETVLRRPVPLTVAGRTDAGVHAAAQVAHFDVDNHESQQLTVRRLQSLINREYAQLWRKEVISTNLSRTEAGAGTSDITLVSLTAVTNEFDARFSAVGRGYVYTVADGRAKANPLARMHRWEVGYDLNEAAMAEAAQHLVGEWDFLSFCRPREGATTIRTLRELSVGRTAPDRPIRFTLEADAFCHSMVRTLVGALVEVGRGQRTPDWARNLVKNPSREWGVPVAPARGLVLEFVEYPPEDLWGTRARQARNRRSMPVSGASSIQVSPVGMASEESGTLP